MTPTLVTLGMDVSDRYSSYCVVDLAGDVVEEGRLRTTASVLSSRFKDFTGRVALTQTGLLMEVIVSCERVS